MLFFCGNIRLLFLALFFCALSFASLANDKKANTHTSLEDYVTVIHQASSEISQNDGINFDKSNLPLNGLFIKTSSKSSESEPVSLAPQKVVIGKPEGIEEYNSTDESGSKKGVIDSLRGLVSSSDKKNQEKEGDVDISLEPPVVVEGEQKEVGGVRGFIRGAKKNREKQLNAGVGKGEGHALYWQKVRDEYMRKRKEKKQRKELLEQKEIEDIEKSKNERFVPNKKPNHTYRNVRSSPVISKKFYNKENDHLPKAIYEQEYVNILFESIISGRSDVMRAMIKRFGTTEVRNKNGDTALLYAVMAGNPLPINLLLGLDAAVDVHNYNGVTPLLAAVSSSRVDIVKALLKRGANPKLTNKDGLTPLMLAVQNDDLEIADLLIKNGADVNKRLKNGDASLHLAARYNSASAAYLLITKGAANEMRNFKGYTPIMISALTGSSAVADILIKTGSDLEKVDSIGRNIMQLAEFKGHYNLARSIEGERMRRLKMAEYLAYEDRPRLVKKTDYISDKGPVPFPKRKPNMFKPIPQPLFTTEEKASMEVN